MSLSLHVLCFVCWSESCPCLAQFFGHQLGRIGGLEVSQVFFSFPQRTHFHPARVPYHLLYTEGKLFTPLPQLSMNWTEPPAKNNPGPRWGHPLSTLIPLFLEQWW